MTAQLLSVDGARVSARARLFADEVIDVQPVLDRLAREVGRKAGEMFGDLEQQHHLYITYEVVAVLPEPDPAA